MSARALKIATALGIAALPLAGCVVEQPAYRRPAYYAPPPPPPPPGPAVIIRP